MQTEKNQNLIISVDWFAPGFRAGGPIRSCTNLTTLIGDYTDVFIVTSNRDLGVKTAYPNLSNEGWVNWKNKAQVIYCNGSIARIKYLIGSLCSNPSSTLYLNSVFSAAGTLCPLLWIWLTRRRQRTVLAPRGMLKDSALSQKRWKKAPTLFLMRVLGLVKNVTFHATSEKEVQEIHNAFGDVEIMMVSNVPTKPLTDLPKQIHQPSQTQLCCIARIHPIKNVLWLLEAMQSVSSSCHLTIVGPNEDEIYYRRCQSKVKTLPKNVSVEFAGPKQENEISKILIESQAMILPTQGENFGHAIFESLAVGTPVIISDRTIWRNLQAKSAGWDLSLEDSSKFVDAIAAVASMSQDEHRELRSGALRLATTFIKDNEFEEEYARLLFRPNG